MTLFIEAHDALRNLGKPTIARLNGIVAGGGNEWNLDCDLAVTEDVRGMPVVMDVTDRRSVAGGVDRVVAAWGRIDVLVAGWDRIAPFLDTTEEFWDRAIAVNYRGILATCHCVLPYMAVRKHRVIVNVASEAGRAGSSGGAVYSGAKRRRDRVQQGAREGSSPRRYPRQRRRAEPHRHAAAPGRDRRRRRKAHLDDREGHAARSEEIAHAVLFLASDAASFITGQTLSVGGELTMV